MLKPALLTMSLAQPQTLFQRHFHLILSHKSLDAESTTSHPQVLKTEVTLTTVPDSTKRIESYKCYRNLPHALLARGAQTSANITNAHSGLSCHPAPSQFTTCTKHIMQQSRFTCTPRTATCLFSPMHPLSAAPSKVSYSLTSAYNWPLNLPTQTTTSMCHNAMDLDPTIVQTSHIPLAVSTAVQP